MKSGRVTWYKSMVEQQTRFSYEAKGLDPGQILHIGYPTYIRIALQFMAGAKLVMK